jgi:hypothetical protein
MQPLFMGQARTLAGRPRPSHDAAPVTLREKLIPTADGLVN